MTALNLNVINVPYDLIHNGPSSHSPFFVHIAELGSVSSPGGRLNLQLIVLPSTGKPPLPSLQY